MYNQCLTRLEVLNVFSLQIEARLNDRALRCQHHHLVVLIPESRTDAPRVAHGKHLSAARQSAHHIATVEMRHRGFQDVGHTDVVVNILCDVYSRKPLFPGFYENPLYLTVQPMSHQFESDVGVAIDTRRLPL